MPAIDLNKQYDRVEERVKSLETYNQVTDATKQIISQQTFNYWNNFPF